MGGGGMWKIIRVASINVLTRLIKQTLYMIGNVLVRHKCTSMAILI